MGTALEQNPGDPQPEGAGPERDACCSREGQGHTPHPEPAARSPRQGLHGLLRLWLQRTPPLTSCGMTFPGNQPCPSSRLRICFQDPSNENRHQAESTHQQNHRLPRSLLFTLTCDHMTEGKRRSSDLISLGSSLLLWFRSELPCVAWLPSAGGGLPPDMHLPWVFQDLPSGPHAYQGRGPLTAEGTGYKQKLLGCETRGNILMVGRMKTWVFPRVTGLSLSPGCVPLSLPLQFLAGEALTTFGIPLLP